MENLWPFPILSVEFRIVFPCTACYIVVVEWHLFCVSERQKKKDVQKHETCACLYFFCIQLILCVASSSPMCVLLSLLLLYLFFIISCCCCCFHWLWIKWKKKKQRRMIHVIKGSISCERRRLRLPPRGERLMNSFSSSRISYSCAERRAHCLRFPWHTRIYLQ